MTGAIEDDDPGQGSLHLHGYFAASVDDEVPPLDVEFFVDRLRFMGLDQDLIEEADRRLRADANAGMQWVEERLEALEPPRKAPRCSCGEPLVSEAWRGRASVRCSVCGSR